MNKTLIPTMASALILSGAVGAASFEKYCNNLESCVQLTSELTGKEYIYSDKLKGVFKSSKTVEVTDKNADLILTHLLNDSGYTRIPIDDNSFKIISARDVRYTPTPLVKASFNKEPTLPNLADYYMMNYKARSPMALNSITRSLRPFMSRYGRIISNELGGSLVVQDTAINLKRIYKLIKDMDKKPTKEAIKLWSQKQKRWHEKSLMEAKNCKNSK